MKKSKMRWILLNGLFLFLFGVSANSQELPKTEKDWWKFDSYNFTGSSSGFTYVGNIYFKRNGVEVDIKEDSLTFMKNARFTTSSSFMKLEQNKLIVSTTKEFTSLVFSADKVEEKEGKIYLLGNALLSFPNNSTFKANEIIIERKNSLKTHV